MTCTTSPPPHLSEDNAIRNWRHTDHNRQSKHSIENHFDKSYELEYSLNRAGKDRDLKKIRKITDLADICYVRQKNLNGLGDAVKCSERHVGDEAFAVISGHTITQNHTRQLRDAYDKYNTSVVSLKTVSPDDAGRHKIISAENVEDNTYKIKEIINNPLGNPPSNLAVIGRYILTPEIFEKNWWNRKPSQWNPPERCAGKIKLPLWCSLWGQVTLHWKQTGLA